mmetsp:Transcript_129446/g.192702  ORF Transcript_129446/g.192702 Transcript_129446/m.192702 type:complete len:199 (+) Transcript_129446:100-696(+)|eukprot:CAMPEP_0116997666 /NCGR_PEP_ID=MMETSP0472-20121206/1022_1 /TAXON_ID=693140 ORGANISM="Tiarina fusus, Strain LIS" /NCGR_SAMPLE_ID=MMETSP0472 /ASSEMBLY_ACC=CAM_ASM_000603 /LENGTH=198 /DNA_ID=CAMNT_0004696615 /DNA_START=94 /DNA_END=690 /DNA_ORIENTATION=-
MTGGGSSPFWDRRLEQETLGNANGLMHFPGKAIYAGAQGAVAGLAFGALQWAYYPDKMAFGHKNTVTSGPSRGAQYIRYTMVRPAVAMAVTNMVFASVESFLEEVRGSHQKDPWNAVGAGAAAGLVIGGFFTKRFDVASMTALGTGLLMGMVEFNGPSIICDPETEQARKHPKSLPAKFEESATLSDLKKLYPKYENN